MNEQDIIGTLKFKIPKGILPIISEYSNSIEYQKLKLIGVLTCSIRGSWTDIDDRLETIHELCEELGKKKWLKWLKKNEEYIYQDGRIFRDEWPGEYGSCNINEFDKEFLDEYIDIFPYPEYDFYGYGDSI